MKKDFKGHEEKGGIYRIINVKNEKFYIGSAKCFKKRVNRHEYDLRNQRHRNKHLQASWNKWGEDAFLFEVVEVIDGEISKIREVEQQFIDKFWGNPNLLNHSKKVTKTQGPWSSTPEETRRKKSEILKKLHCDPEFRIKYEEGRKKAAEKTAKSYEFISPNGEFLKITNLKEFCRKHQLSDSSMHHVWTEKVRSHRGWRKHNPSKIWDKWNKTVYQYNLNGSFVKKWNSASEAARSLNLRDSSKISECANGKLLTSGGFIWKFDDGPIDLSKINKREKIPKKVYQFDLQNNLLRQWSSVSEAAKKTGCSVSSISECANKKRNSAGGYVWSYDPPKSK